MNDKQFEALIKALERIAAALEQANIRDMYPPITVTPAPQATFPAGTAQPAGFTCGSCGRWVPVGSLHSCNSIPSTTMSYCTVCGTYYVGHHHCPGRVS